MNLQPGLVEMFTAFFLAAAAFFEWQRRKRKRSTPPPPPGDDCDVTHDERPKGEK